MASCPRPQKNQRATAPETKEPIMLLCWLLRWFWMISINSNSATYQNNRVPHWKNRFDLILTVGIRLIHGTFNDPTHSSDLLQYSYSDNSTLPTNSFFIWCMFSPFFFFYHLWQYYLIYLVCLFLTEIGHKVWEGLARKWHSLRYSVLESIQESLKGFYLYKICIIASKIQLKLYLGWISKPPVQKSTDINNLVSPSGFPYSCLPFT